MTSRIPSDLTTRVRAQDSTRADLHAAVPAGSSPLGVGQKLDRYYITGVLGSGGMGDVYRAFDPDLERGVAIKVMQGGTSPAARSILMHEAQALARLTHPNVVAVYDVGTIDEADREAPLFLVMELVTGVDLAVWTRKRREWPVLRAVFLAAARGLAAAHRAHIVHRDFKPANVLVSERGEVRVADFGLARQLAAVPATDGDAATGLLATSSTATGLVMGTPAYMAPEVHQGRPATAASDQYSFFVALFEAITGRRPFEGHSIAELVERKRQRVARLDDVAVPTAVCDAIARGLEPDPALRFADMDAVIAALEPRARRSALVWIAGGVVATVVAGTVIGTHRQDRCAHADDLAASIWSDPRREQARAAFLALPTEHAAESWTRVDEAMSAHVLQWRTAYAEVCSTTPEVGEMAWTGLDPLTRCLRHQQIVADAVARSWVEIDASTAALAPEAVARLASADECRRDASASRLPAEPAAELRESVERARTQLDEVEALRLADRFDGATAVIDSAWSDWSAIDYTPLHAEAHLMRALVRSGAGASRAAHEDAFAAMLLAERSDHDRVAARALRIAVLLRATRLGEPEAARPWLALATAWHLRVADPDASLAMERTTAVVLAKVGDLATAATQLRTALDAMSTPARPSTIADAEKSLADVLLDLGELDEAEVHARRAIEVRERAFGPNASSLAPPLITLAMILQGRSRLDEADEVLARTSALQAGNFGPGHERTLALYNLQGNNALERRDLDRAQGYFEQVVARADVADPSGRLALTGRVNLGMVAMQRGELGLALHHFENAPDLAPQLRDTMVSTHMIAWAATARMCGDSERALAAIDSAAEVVEEAGARPATAVPFRLKRAMVAYSAGDRDDALAQLDVLRQTDGLEVEARLMVESTRGWLLREGGQCAQASDGADVLATLPTATLAPELVFAGLGEAAEIRACSGRTEAADELRRRALALPVRLMDVPLLDDAATRVRLGAASIWWTRGELDRGVAWATVALEGAPPGPVRAAVLAWMLTHRIDCTRP